MKKIYKDAECQTHALDNKTVAIVGYGSQGHAHALNLKESGYNVIVALYDGSKSWAKAEAAGLKVMTTAEATKVADVIMILINDEHQPAMYEKDILPNLTEGKALAFAHGFNIHFQRIVPPTNVDVFLIAPKARAIPSALNTPSGVAYLVCMPFIKTIPATVVIYHLLMVMASVAAAQDFLRPLSEKRPKQTCLASKPFSAVVFLS